MPIAMEYVSPTEILAIVRNSLSEIPVFAEALETFGEQNGVPSTVIFNFNLAVDELLTNIINYGYDDDAADHQIRMHVLIENDVMSIEIVDDARAFNPLTAAEPDVGAPMHERPIGGLGVHLVRTMMDDVTYAYRDSCNVLKISKAFQPQAETNAQS